MTLTLPDTEPAGVPRDRWGRPLIVPNGATKRVPYTRPTTIAKTIEDQHSLIGWKSRVTAIGLTRRPELLKMIAVADDRKTLDRLCEEAAAAGGATERRDEGTALHRAIELSLLGQPVPALFAGDVAAVHAALERHNLTVVAGMTERMCVNDELKLAGTFDMIVTDGATNWIGDIKTGASLDYSGLAFAVQLAIYANSPWLYTHGAAAEFDVRTPMPDVSRTVGMILHIQPGSGRCDIHGVDIGYGAQTLQLCVAVREARNKARTLITQLEHPSPTAGVEAVEPPKAPAASEGSRPETKREWITQRARALRELDPDALRHVMARLPADITPLMSKKLMTAAELDAYDQALAVIERAIEAPFVPGVAQIPRPQPEPVVPVTRPSHAFDEGADIDAATVAAMRKHMTELEGDAAEWAIRVLREARDAGTPISITAKPTMRSLHLSHAIHQWAAIHDDTATRVGLAFVGADPGDAPIGAAIGALTLEQAAVFGDIPQQPSQQ